MDNDDITNTEDSDTDGDGMPDRWESDHSLDPFGDDAHQNGDIDSRRNVEEYRRGGDPQDPNSVPASSTEFLRYPQLAVGSGYYCVIMITNRADQRWEGAGDLY